MRLANWACAGNEPNTPITSPDPDYVRKKNRRDSLIRLVLAHPTWALGFLDEVWWSRLAQPDQHRWVDEDDMTRLQELELSKEDTDPRIPGLLWSPVAPPSQAG